MNINLISTEKESKPKIKYGDVLLCADGHDVNYIMIIEVGNLPAALNLGTYIVESEADTFSELYGFISNGYDIKNIINKENVILNINCDK
jgi:hypothetical protein